MSIIWSIPNVELDDFHPRQIINNHIPAHTNPTPSKPAHLAFMRRSHRLLSVPKISRSTHNKQGSRKVPFLLRPPDTRDDRERRVQNTEILSQDTRRRECVEFNRTFPTCVPLHKILEKRSSAVEEGYVVWMAGHAASVECNDCI